LVDPLSFFFALSLQCTIYFLYQEVYKKKQSVRKKQQLALRSISWQGNNVIMVRMHI